MTEADIESTKVEDKGGYYEDHSRYTLFVNS